MKKRYCDLSEEQKARQRAACRKYRALHRAECSARSMRYQAAHPEQTKAIKRKWDKLHGAARTRAWRAANPDAKQYYDYCSNEKQKEKERTDPDYAEARRQQKREHRAAAYRRTHPNAKPYQPRPSARLPEWAPRGYTLDGRAPWLWNNLTPEQARENNGFARELALSRRRD